MFEPITNKVYAIEYMVHDNFKNKPRMHLCSSYSRKGAEQKTRELEDFHKLTIFKISTFQVDDLQC